MYTDPIADYLTRIRNAQMVMHNIVEIPHSKIKELITKILFEQGYILQYKIDDLVPYKKTIKIALKYNKETKKPIIQSLKRISKPGLRQYSKATELKKVINGLGIAIISTTDGLMTDKEAVLKNIGGEIICHIY